MITCVTYQNLTLNGSIFTDQFKLRYEAFIERQNYDVCTYNGMEYDQYDTPATVYLIYAHDDQALGVSRLTPTKQGCMLADLWPHLVEDKSQLCADDVWESTRFAIKKNLPAKLRQQICHELCAAHIEFGLSRNIKKIIGLMPTLILRSVYERSGIYLERLGPIQQIGEHAKVQAAGIPIHEYQIENVFKKTGVSDVLLAEKVNYHIMSNGNAYENKEQKYAA